MTSAKPNKSLRGLLGLLGWVISLIAGDAVSAEFHRPVIDNTRSPHTTLRCVPMQDTRLTTGFWAERVALAKNTVFSASYFMNDIGLEAAETDGFNRLQVDLQLKF